VPDAEESELEDTAKKNKSAILEAS